MKTMEELANCQNMTIKEAAFYSGLGEKRLYDMTNQPGCPFVIFVGHNKRLIKRKKFDQYMEKEAFI